MNVPSPLQSNKSFQLQLSFYLLDNLTITGLREEDVDCFRGDYSF